MNFRGGWALIKSTWMSWLQYRSFFFLLAFGWMIPPLVSLFVWSTAASEKPIQGLTQGEFVAYYLLFILINQLTYSQTNWTVGDSIRNGDMNRALLRPLSPLFSTLSTELAGKVVYMAFVPALLLAWLLRFFWGYWLALLAFWATRANALLEIQDALIFLLAGQVAPVALLPGPLQLLARVLPFRYMIGFPVEVLLGHLTGVDLLIGFAYQCGWCFIALTLFVVIWRIGVQHYTAVGG